jgi:hypothetical protein
MSVPTSTAVAAEDPRDVLIRQLQQENAALRRVLEGSAAATATPTVAADEEEEEHSLPDNRDVDLLLAYVKHASRIYADRSEEPEYHPCMALLKNGDRLYICRDTIRAAAAASDTPVHIHPSRLIKSQLYFASGSVEEEDGTLTPFFAFYNRAANFVYRGVSTLKAALTATIGDGFTLVTKAEDGTFRVIEA